MKINGSIALVTGASSGIGQAAAQRLTAAGYKDLRQKSIEQDKTIFETNFFALIRCSLRRAT